MEVAGRKVLLFGDSLTHVGPDAGPEIVDLSPSGSYGSPGGLLGQRFLRAGAAAVRTDARIGRSATNFWSREDTAKLLGADLSWKPDLVFVMLGTNDLGGDVVAHTAGLVKIRDTFTTHGIEVWGIGPPGFPNAAQAAQAPPVIGMMARVFGPRFIDATKASTGADRTSDGVHFTSRGAPVFAEGLGQLVDAAGHTSLVVRVAKAGLGVVAFAGLVGLAWIIGRRQRMRE